MLTTRSSDLVAGIFGSGTKQERIRAELTRYFKQHGPTHRTILLEHLKKVGLMGQEKDPMGSFAAYLSGWKDIFAFDGKGVWGLPDQFNEEDIEEDETTS